MRLLLINPNTTAAMTERMAEVAAGIAGPEVEIQAVTAERGVPYIASRAEAQLAGCETLEMLARHGQEADAAIIAASAIPVRSRHGSFSTCLSSVWRRPR